MIKLIKSFILTLLLLYSSYGYASYLDKNVKLEAGQCTLKAALKSFSDQTGCIFSYNPISIQDNQVLSVTSNYSNKLEHALKKFLPSDISFVLNGKYLVLQKQNIEPKQDQLITKQSAFQKQKSKADSKIDKDPKKVRLVLPPMSNTNDKLQANNQVETKDSNVFVYPDKNLEILLLKTDSLYIETDIQKSYSLANYQELKFSASEIRKHKTINFVTKRVVLDIDLASNTPLSSMSVNAGLYGFYGTLSIASDYNNSYRLGYGFGCKFKIKDNLGINLNLIQHTLFAGKSYELGVRATLTHFDPVISYSVGKGFSFFVGPSFFYSESRYQSTDSATNLGGNFGLGAMIGVKFNIIDQLFKKDS